MSIYLKHLYLRNFRNYEEAEISFAPRVNIIWGDNAQGKTNLLEAIHLLSTGKSFRTQHLSELIREGSEFFYLEATLIQNEISQSIRLSFNGHDKRLEVNASVHSSFAPLLGTLPLVLHAPNDGELITGSPSERRRFLNFHLAQSDPLYVHHLTRFWRAMKQRNHLLRTRIEEGIECWEEEMAKSAAYLYQMRRTFVEELHSPFKMHSATLSGNLESHELHYHPSHPENYLYHLQKNRHRERDLGLTMTGPHRDDLSFSIGGRAAKLFASEGQKKTAIASLRLAEWDQWACRLGFSPLMAIDDLGLFLDKTRETLFLEKLIEIGQVFITTPSPTLDLSANKIEIKNGNKNCFYA